jgi:hypothetical protein
VLALAVPVITLPALPQLSWWPALLGMLPWVFGKYVLCPLRWHALSTSGRSRRWHLRAYAEAELCGLLTPGHVGADAWRVRRLTRTGMSTPDAVAEAGLDRFVGAIGLAAFVGFSATALPVRMLLVALGLAATAVVVAVLVGRRKPHLVPTRRLPSRRALAYGVLCPPGLPGWFTGARASILNGRSRCLYALRLSRASSSRHVSLAVLVDRVSSMETPRMYRVAGSTRPTQLTSDGTSLR